MRTEPVLVNSCQTWSEVSARWFLFYWNIIGINQDFCVSEDLIPQRGFCSMKFSEHISCSGCKHTGCSAGSCTAQLCCSAWMLSLSPCSSSALLKTHSFSLGGCTCGWRWIEVWWWVHLMIWSCGYNYSPKEVTAERFYTVPCPSWDWHYIMVNLILAHEHELHWTVLSDHSWGEQNPVPV